MVNPRVSIQICCYNSGRYLDDTIRSVMAQSYHDWELIIVNDGSTDSTEAIVKKYIAQKVPINYFYQPNAGFSAARNKALELSRGEWIAILDHDDLWHSDKLLIQCRAIDEFPGAKLYFSNSEWFDDSGAILRRTIEHDKFKTGIIPQAFYKLLAEGCFIDSETVLINRQALLECGGFDPQLRYLADYEAFIRLAFRYDCCYEDRILAKCRVHPDQATQRMRKLFLQERAALFAELLAEHVLPLPVKKEMQSVIVADSLRYALLQLRENQIWPFLVSLNKATRFPEVAIFLQTRIPRLMRKIAGNNRLGVASP